MVPQKHSDSVVRSAALTIPEPLDLYAQGDGDETRAAQGAFLREMGLASELVQ